MKVVAADRLPALEQRSLTSVSPAAASSVGNQSRPENISLETSPGLILPGQRTIAGTRKAPSQFVSFSLRNGVVAASGQVNWLGPLSVVKTTMVLSAIFEVVERLQQLADVPVHLDHAVGILVAGHAALPAHRVAHVGEDVHAREVHPGEERLAALHLLVHELDGRAVVSSSIVSMRLRFSGPVSSILPSAKRMQHAARRVGLDERLHRPSASRAAPAPPRHSGGRGCRRTRRSRGWSAGTRPGRRGGSCRTARWRSRAASAPGRS